MEKQPKETVHLPAEAFRLEFFCLSSGYWTLLNTYRTLEGAAKAMEIDKDTHPDMRFRVMFYNQMA